MFLLIPTFFATERIDSPDTSTCLRMRRHWDGFEYMVAPTGDLRPENIRSRRGRTRYLTTEEMDFSDRCGMDF